MWSIYVELKFGEILHGFNLSGGIITIWALWWWSFCLVLYESRLIASKGDPDPVVLIGAVKKTFIVTSTQENNRKKTSWAGQSWVQLYIKSHHSLSITSRFLKPEPHFENFPILYNCQILGGWNSSSYLPNSWKYEIRTPRDQWEFQEVS